MCVFLIVLSVNFVGAYCFTHSKFQKVGAAGGKKGLSQRIKRYIKRGRIDEGNVVYIHLVTCITFIFCPHVAIALRKLLKELDGNDADFLFEFFKQIIILVCIHLS